MAVAVDADLVAEVPAEGAAVLRGAEGGATAGVAHGPVGATGARTRPRGQYERLLRGVVAPTTITLTRAALDDAGPLGAGVVVAVAGARVAVAAASVRAAIQARAQTLQDAPIAAPQRLRVVEGPTMTTRMTTCLEGADDGDGAQGSVLLGDAVGGAGQAGGVVRVTRDPVAEDLT